MKYEFETKEGRMQRIRDELMQEAKDELNNYENQKAIKYLKRKRNLPGNPEKWEYDSAIYALEKTIPKKVVIKNYGTAHCPMCGTDIHGKGQIKYCFNCGQMVEWP